jgi:two-component system, chemotaxis family, CheB/CheR fusion protein
MHAATVVRYAQSGETAMPGPSGLTVVGIGASAGGVEALAGFFRNVPADSRLAFVVVTHLSPGRESHLRSILASRAAIAFERARDGVVLEPGRAYVLDAAGTLTVDRGRLRVRHDDGNGRREQNPIDILFASLAEDLGERAIGVVLSGGGGDGTIGLKAIKEHGGLTVAQGSDGSAPRHASMPESAVSSGSVDLRRAASRLRGRHRQVRRDRHGRRTADRGRGEPRRRAAGHLRGAARSGRPRLLRLQGEVLPAPGAAPHAGAADRDRRGLPGAAAPDSDEVTKLFRDLLIGVTAFFRDGDGFEALRRVAIPRLFEGRGADDAVRVWVPGCATGEEAYSIAMLLREHMDGLRAAPRVQVFATDIDEPALNVARSGRYPAAMVDGAVPQDRLRRFFTADGESAVVGKDVRDLCIFSAHSVVRDPPFSRIDLVSCRNLLIYLDGEVQRRVIPVFHYALRPGGWLFLGPSESVGQYGELFASADKKHRIFRRRDHASAVRVPLWLHGPRSGHHHPDGAGERRPGERPAHRAAAPERGQGSYAGGFRAGPCGGGPRGRRGPHYSARTGKYLEAAPGAPSRQIIVLARKGLRLELRAVLREAMETRRPACRDDGTVEVDGQVQPVSVLVEPLGEGDGRDPLFLVVFSDQGAPLPSGDTAGPGCGLT